MFEEASPWRAGFDITIGADSDGHAIEGSRIEASNHHTLPHPQDAIEPVESHEGTRLALRINERPH